MELCPALDVLYDEGVRAFLSRELYRYVDREAFDKLEMPAGCGYDEMWELLGAVRNVVGVHLLSDLSNVIDYGELWYVCTPERRTRCPRRRRPARASSRPRRSRWR